MDKISKIVPYVPKPEGWGSEGDKFLAGDGTLKEVSGTTIKGVWHPSTLDLTLPENAANNAFILDVEEPIYIPELDKELESGDIVFFDVDGVPFRYIPKEFVDDVVLSDYTKKNADEEITGAWAFKSNDPILQSLNAKYEPLKLKLGQIPMASVLTTVFGELGILINPDNNAFILGVDRDVSEGSIRLETLAFDTVNNGTVPLAGLTAVAQGDGDIGVMLRVLNRTTGSTEDVRLQYRQHTGKTEFNVGGLEISSIGEPTSSSSAIRFEDIFYGGVPTTSNSNGKKGQIAADGNYFYICYFENSWIRIAKDNNW